MKRKYRPATALRSIAVICSALIANQALADLPQPANDPHTQVHDGKGGQHKWAPPPQPYKVLADNKVVFTIRAPQVSDVEVQGGAKGDSRVKLTKGAD